MPNLGFTRDRRDCTHFLFPQSVDNRRFTNIGITDQTNGNLFSVGMKRRELTKELNERTLAEGIVNVGVESQSGEFCGEGANPGGLCKRISFLYTSCMFVTIRMLIVEKECVKRY